MSRTSQLLIIFPVLVCLTCQVQVIAGAIRKGTLISHSDWLNDVDGDNIPGRAGIDYPVYASVPQGTSFRCKGYDYAGYFGDVETDCQAFHVCYPDGRNASFLCVNGTVFHQRYYVCDWWFHFNCSHAYEMYELNLYRKVPLPVLAPVRRRVFPPPSPVPQPMALPGPPPRAPKNIPVKDDEKKKRKFSDEKDRNPVTERPSVWNSADKDRRKDDKQQCDCRCDNAPSASNEYISSHVQYE